MMFRHHTLITGLCFGLIKKESQKVTATGLSASTEHVHADRYALLYGDISDVRSRDFRRARLPIRSRKHTGKQCCGLREAESQKVFLTEPSATQIPAQEGSA